MVACYAASAALFAVAVVAVVVGGGGGCRSEAGCFFSCVSHLPFLFR